MIASSLRLQLIYTFVFNAVMVMMAAVLLGTIIRPSDDAVPLLIALSVWIVLLVTVTVVGTVLVRRAEKAIKAQTAAASPGIAQDQGAPLVAAQVVRRRLARGDQAYAAGFAPTHPPAFAVLVRLAAPETPRLALALAPPPARAGAYAARSYLGVRVDPAHPDVAVVDLAASPEAMKVAYADVLARPGVREPGVGWADATLWSVAGMAVGAVVGLLVGVLLP